MSFGFSAGDFVLAAKLITNVINSLRASSTSEHRELTVELHNLERALNDIEHIESDAEQTTAMNAVKVTALTCRYPLEEFEEKLKKYVCLQEPSVMNVRQKAYLWKKKLEWGFSMEEEAQRLRTYLIMHVGSLNMRLIALGL